MKELKLILILTLLTGYSAVSQVTFEKLYSNKSTDVFRSVQVVPAGGYIAAGYVSDSTVSDTDAYVVRMDVNGDTMWTYRYNSPQNGKDLFYKILVTSDGNFIACGYTLPPGQSDEVLYIKLNSSGINQWTRTYGGSGRDRAQDIIETNDGYTIAGYTTSPPAQYYDAFLIHTDLNGNVQWNKVIGFSDYDDANTIKKLPDDGYILGGQSTNGADFQQFLIRTNSSGDTMWTKRFGTPDIDNIESLVVIANGYMIAGGTHSTLNGDDGYLVKTDTAGNVQWTKTFGDTAQDDFHRIEKTTDGGYILSGTTSSYGPLKPNMWLVKTDSQGNQSWSTTFGGINHDHGYSAVQTSDGGYIIAGHSGSFGFNNEEAYIVKLAPSGTPPLKLTYVSAFKLISPTCSGNSSVVKVVVWNFGNVAVSNFPVTVEVTGGLNTTLQQNYAGTLPPQTFDTLTFTGTINTSGGGSFTFFGHTGNSNDVYPQRNSFTITTMLLPCVGIDEVQSHLGFELFPNPTQGNIILNFSEHYSDVSVELFDITGKLLGTYSDISKAENKIINVSEFPEGIYFLKVNADGMFDVRKLVKY